jgi:hypothetical protein
MDKKTERITIRLSADLHARMIAGAAAANQWSLSAYATAIVEANVPALAPVVAPVAPVAPVAAPASVVVFKTKAKPKATKAKPKAKKKK